MNVEAPVPASWSGLLLELKLGILSMLDYKSRRALLACSREDRELLQTFVYRKEMDTTIEFRDAINAWICTYDGRQESLNPGFSSTAYARRFHTAEEAYQHMRYMIKNTEIVTYLRIFLEIDSEINLRDDRHLVIMEKMSVKFLRGYDKATNNSFDYFFRQIDLPKLKSFNLVASELRIDQTHLTDRFFEFEQTVLNLNRLYLNCAVNDQQLVGIRTKNTKLSKCTDITVDGLVQLVQRTVLEGREGLVIMLERVSERVQMFLFEQLFDNFGDVIELYFNMIGTRQKMRLFFYVRHPQAVGDRARNFFVIVNSRPNNYGLVEHIERNNSTLELYPSLQNFIDAVSEGLPEDFFLRI